MTSNADRSTMSTTSDKRSIPTLVKTPSFRGSSYQPLFRSLAMASADAEIMADPDSPTCMDIPCGDQRIENWTPATCDDQPQSPTSSESKKNPRMVMEDGTSLKWMSQKSLFARSGTMRPRYSSAVWDKGFNSPAMRSRRSSLGMDTGMNSPLRRGSSFRASSPRRGKESPISPRRKRRSSVVVSRTKPIEKLSSAFAIAALERVASAMEEERASNKSPGTESPRPRASRDPERCRSLRDRGSFTLWDGGSFDWMMFLFCMLAVITTSVGTLVSTPARLQS